MNASVRLQPEGQLHFRQEQSMKGTRLPEKTSGERSVAKTSEDLLRPCRRGEELSAKVKVVLFLLPEWTLQRQACSAGRPGGHFGDFAVLYERAAAEGRTGFMPPGRLRRSHLPDVNPSAVTAFMAMFCNQTQITAGQCVESCLLFTSVLSESSTPRCLRRCSRTCGDHSRSTNPLMNESPRHG